MKLDETVEDMLSKDSIKNLKAHKNQTDIRINKIIYCIKKLKRNNADPNLIRKYKRLKNYMNAESKILNSIIKGDDYNVD